MESKQIEEMNVLSNYVVAFIDIQGQTEKLLKYPLLPDNQEQQSPEFIDYLKSTFGTVIQFNKSFKDYFSQVGTQKYKYFDTAKYNPNNIQSKTVSDSLIMYSSIKNVPDTIPVIDIFNMFFTCAGNFVLYLSQGVVYRGAIEIGLGMEHPDIGFYGPAIALPYCMEAKIANTPRILIGNQLFDYLENISVLENSDAFNSDDDKLKISKTFAKLLLEQAIIKDHDGQKILNYLAPVYTEVYKTIHIDGLENVVGSAYAFVEKSLNDFKDNDKLKNKYLYIKDFFINHL